MDLNCAARFLMNGAIKLTRLGFLSESVIGTHAATKKCLAAILPKGFLSDHVGEVVSDLITNEDQLPVLVDVSALIEESPERRVSRLAAKTKELECQEIGSFFASL